MQSPYGLEEGLPGAPAKPIPAPYVRGEKQWTTNANNINDWGDTQMTVANTRIPYASTLVQEDDDEPEPNMSMLKTDINRGPVYPEKVGPSVPIGIELLQRDDDDDDEPTLKVENSVGKIPIDYKFMQAVDDDPTKMESVMMEDPEIPLNMRLVQTEEGSLYRY